MDTVDHSGHRQRLRRALRENGLSAFASHEVIEILLYPALPRRDVNELAHRLDEAFGGVNGLLKADMNALTEKGGLSRNTAEYIMAVGACVNEYAESRPAGNAVLTLRDAENCLPGVYSGPSLILLSAGRRVIFSSALPQKDAEKFICSRALIYDAACAIVRGARFEGLRQTLALTGTEYIEIQ